MLTLNYNFVVKNKTETNYVLKYTKHENSSHNQVSAHYHTNKTISNLQTWHSLMRKLQRWSHKDDKHKICSIFAVQLAYSVSYGDQWSARQFNRAAKWPVVTTSPPINVPISNFSSSSCNLKRFLSPMHTCK